MCPWLLLKSGSSHSFTSPPNCTFLDIHCIVNTTNTNFEQRVWARSLKSCYMFKERSLEKGEKWVSIFALVPILLNLISNTYDILTFICIGTCDTTHMQLRPTGVHGDRDSKTHNNLVKRVRNINESETIPINIKTTEMGQLTLRLKRRKEIMLSLPQSRMRETKDVSIIICDCFQSRKFRRYLKTLALLDVLAPPPLQMR